MLRRSPSPQSPAPFVSLDMSASPSKRSRKIPPLPTLIRNELRMTCALRAYNDLKSGSKKKVSDQHKFMSLFYHGKPPNHPAQIQLLSEARLKYRELYDEVDVPTTSKRANELSSVKRFQLKKSLSRDNSRSYCSGIDIRLEDLEKKNKTGSVLITGRNLLDLAVKGLRSFKKALAFNSAVWDSEKLIPKKSGESIEDCIEYVRRRMYIEEKKPEHLCESVNSEEEDEDIENGDHEIDLDGENIEKNNENEEDRAKVNGGNEELTKSNDSGNNTNINDDVTSIASEISTSSLDIPDDYLFPSFFVFVLWGPYVPPDHRLNISLTTDRDRTKSGSVRELKKKESEQKKLNAQSTMAFERGFSTDQRIELDNLKERRFERRDRNRESKMVGLCIEEGAISRQIVQAEKRAEARCSDYDPDNVYWQRVDQLLKMQQEITDRISRVNSEEEAAVVEEIPKMHKDNENVARLEDSAVTSEIAVGSDSSDDIGSQSNTKIGEESNESNTNTGKGIDNERKRNSTKQKTKQPKKRVSRSRK